MKLKKDGWKQNQRNGKLKEKKGIEQGSEKKELEMYQIMVDKGFSISSIASIFSVSEESIRKLLIK